MNREPNPSDVSAIVAGNSIAVQKHRGIIGALTVGAFGLGILAVAASVLLASAYFILYRPKQMQLFREYEKAIELNRQTQTEPGVTEPFPGRGGRKDSLSTIHLTLTHATSFGMMWLAVSVALLGAGTLLTMLLIIFQRKATMHQINEGLVQISNQLRELRPPR